MKGLFDLKELERMVEGWRLRDDEMTDKHYYITVIDLIETNTGIDLSALKQEYDPEGSVIIERINIEVNDTDVSDDLL